MKEFQAIMQSLSCGEYKPVYLLYGTETYFIDKITDYITHHILSEVERGFNQTIVYGRDVNAGTILEICKRYPMMAKQQVVVVREAQNLRDLDQLEHYMANPVETTILVLAYKHKKPDGRKKVIKNIKKNGVVFESKPLYENQMQSWINSFVHQHKRTITPKAALLISDFIGPQLTLAANEMEKLFITVPEGQLIDENSVSKVIGINKDYNDFELSNALGDRNKAKALRIANYFAQNSKEHPLIVTISVLTRFYTQLMLLHFSPNKSAQELAQILGVHPYFVKQYIQAKNKITGSSVAKCIEILREYDIKSKGINAGSVPQGELLKEMIYKLIHT